MYIFDRTSSGFFFFNSCSTFSSIKKCEAMTVWKSYHRISVSMKRDNIHTILWCFDRLDNYKCPYIRRVYIGNVWFDPGVWLWDSAGGLTASCLSHLLRECQTVYLTRYALSVFSLSQPWMRTHVYKKIHMHCHATYTYTNIRKTHINTLKCMSL